VVEVGRVGREAAAAGREEAVVRIEGKVVMARLLEERMSGGASGRSGRSP